MVRAIGRKIVLCAALSLGAAAGCSPIVSVHHAEVRGGSLSGLDVIVYLEVENENAFDIELRRVHANVTIAGRYRLAPVDVQPRKWLPANRKTRVAMPITIPWTEVPGILAETVGSSEISYKVRGTADVTAGRSARVKRDRYPIDESGEIPRRLVAGAAHSGLPLP